MKPSITLVFLLALPVLGYNQQFYFDGSDRSEVMIDSINKVNDWIIGPPRKSMIKSAYSLPNCITTKLDTTYTTNLSSAFTFLSPEEVTWADYPYVIMEFYHFMDADPGKDGGIIEVSYNSDSTWTNLFEDSLNRVMMTTLDTVRLPNGEIGVSTSLTRWNYAFICWNDMVPVDELYFRFSWFSDSIPTEKDGWAIDDLDIYPSIVDNVSESSRAPLTIYPNPFSDWIMIDDFNDGSYRLLDQNGIVLKEGSVNQGKISAGSLPRGLYFVQLQREEATSTYRVIKR